MLLRILRVDSGYLATVTPSHGDNVYWELTSPVGQGVPVDALIELGFHQQDIGDALYEADPDWLDRPLDEGNEP